MNQPPQFGMQPPHAAYVQPGPYAQHPSQSPYGQYSQPPNSYGTVPQPVPFMPGPQQAQAAQALGLDPVMTGLAGNVLQQQGANYLQKGQAFMQSKMGFLSGGILHYHFNISSEYVRSKLLMLLAPFLRHWNYTRILEQIAGGHKYLPPRQDVNAPDLYIPFMAMCTYCLLASIAMALGRRFSPDSMYATVSSAMGAWTVHWLVLKTMLYLLGIPSAVPFLELAAYAGYAFAPVCASMVAGMALGKWGFRVVWLYGAVAVGVFMVRTMKRILFLEARQYNVDSKRHNYLLLGLWLFQLPYTAFLAVLP